MPNEGVGLPEWADFDQMADMAWAARCDCRNNHNSNSGRCNTRSDDGFGGHAKGVYDPTHQRGEVAICYFCRTHCQKKNHATQG